MELPKAEGKKGQRQQKLPETISKPAMDAAPSKKTKSKNAPKASGTPKLSAFDEDLMRLISQGTHGQFELLHTLLVDPSEFASRVKFLSNKKFIVRDAMDANVLRLGIKGYNYLKEADGKRQKTSAKSTPALPIQPMQPKSEAYAPEAGENPKPSETPFNERRFPAEFSDLSDLVKKYGPNSAQKNSALPKQVPQAQPFENPATLEPVSTKLRSPSTGTTEEDSCELCKAAFKISANPSEHNPKHGHCFCGAAYHKDCFEALIEGDAKCVRCGRRLRAALDLKSEDAIRKIKSAFD